MKHITGLARDWILATKIDRKEFSGMPLPMQFGLLRTFRHEKLTLIDGQYVINTFLPPFPGAAYQQLCRSTSAVYRKDARPFSAYLAVTNECGFACWHCSKDRRQKNDALSTQQWIEIIRKLQDLGMAIIGFTGGEPLYRQDLEDIIAAVDRRSCVAVFTTGERLSVERAKRLKGLGVMYISISFDHYDKERHNALRGSSEAFDVALSGVRTALAAGFYTAVQLSANKAIVNQRDLDRYREFVSSLGVHEIRITEPMPTGKLVGAGEDILLSDAQRGLLRKFHVEVNRKRKGPKVAAFAYIEDESLYGCGAGVQHMYIDAAGNLCPCDFTPLSFGNVAVEGVDIPYQRLRKSFELPGGKCFVLANKDIIAGYAHSGLPLKTEDSLAVCAHCRRGNVPLFYKNLGWKEKGASL